MPELIIIENSGWGNRIYLNYLSGKTFICKLIYFTEIVFCTYGLNQIIITNMFGMLKVKFIPCYAVNKLHN